MLIEVAEEQNTDKMLKWRKEQIWHTKKQKIDLATAGKIAENNWYKTVLEKRPYIKEVRTQKVELVSALNIYTL